MAQECGFFNAELEGSEYDRVYNAEQFAAYFASFIANGVFGESMGELVVLENQQANMSVDVSSGQGWINGWWYRNTEELNLPIALADGILNRKDIVVLRWGNAERDMWLQVLQGEPSGEPIAPSIVRNADYYDLKLCEIDIPAGTSRITQSLITDTRLDNNVCGLVTGVVQQIDTTQLFIQFQAAYADWKNIQEADYESWTAEQQQDYNTWITTNQNAFITWFNHMKDQLDSDAAGHLQNEIDDLQVYVDEGFDNIELKRFVGENFAEIGTKEGSALAHTIYGMSVQDGTPTPSVPVEIKSAKADFECVGKNLIPYPYYRQSGYSSQGMTGTYGDDGIITINKEAGSATAYFGLYAGYKLLIPNTRYILSMSLENTNSASVFISVNQRDIAAIRNKASGNYEYTFTTPNELLGITQMAIYFEADDVETNCKVKVMLTLADVDQTYEVNKHKDITTNLTLRSIEVASTDDYTYERDGKYYIADTIDWSEDRGHEITRRIGEVVLDGSTPIATISGNTVQIMHTAFSQMRANLNVGYSNRFAHKSSNYTTGGDANTGLSSGEFSYRKGQITTTANQRSIYIKNSDFTTISNASTWFASNNTNIAFVLETPITESITSEQAQALLSLKTYDEASYISSTGSVEPSVDLEYAKSEMGAKALTGHNEAYIAQELEGVYGVKNLIPYPYSCGTSHTENGITYTVNDDGSITANGTATANSFYILILFGDNKVLKSGNYVLSKGNYDTTSIRLNLKIDSESGLNYQSIDSAKSISLVGEHIIKIFVSVISGATLNNVIIKPMLRLASIQSDEYQPYAMSNHELTVANSAVTEKLQASDGLTFDFTKSGNKYGYKDSNGNFVPFNKVQASKTVTASTSTQTVTPDIEYSGIASVTVNPTPSQSKSITATTSAQTVSPDSGKLLSSVTVNPQVHSGTRASVTSNGTIDLGAIHATRYVPVNVPQYNNPFEVITIGMRQLNQEDTCYLTRYNNGLAGGGTLVASQNGRGGSYTLQGNYASYYYNEGVSEDVNYNTVTITLKVRAYIDGVLKNAGETYSFTIGSGYSMPSHIVTPA